MALLHSIFNQAPEIAIFLSLASGYWLGNVQIGKFQLGSVAATLLVAVLISQVGVPIDNGIKSLLFALFIYAVGFESGPQFFLSLGRQSIREVIMAVVLAGSAFLTIIVLAKLFGLDKGLAAGVAAGGLTQSAMIGTASAAIAKLGLNPAETLQLQNNVAIGYAVTYIFGSLGAIIMCVNVLPWLMKRNIRDDALKAEAEILASEPSLASCIEHTKQVANTASVTHDKTDFAFHGLGIVIGLLLGLVVVRIGAIPLTLGCGGGALLSGLVFGCYHSRHTNIGNMPTAASAVLRDFGLAGFVAAVGLQSGAQAIETMSQSGASLFIIGVLVTLIPMLVTMLIGRYVLHYDNTAVFAGALSGARSANPAFGEVLDKAGNSVPTTPFAITYALANVFLTLLGPLVVAFVK
jgi:putative transport protein